MLMFVYCIYDKLAQEASGIFEAKNDGVAFRNFNQTITARREEFSLLCLGTMSHDPVKLNVFPEPREVEFDPEPLKEE